MKHFYTHLGLTLGLILLVSCASTQTGSTTSEKAKTPGTIENAIAENDAEAFPKVLPEPSRKGGVERSAEEIENLTVGDVIQLEEPNTQTLYDNSRYDFPITINSRVEGWIDYFTGRGRPHMEKYLSRSSRYIPMMKVILKNANLPEDLVYLALIESGFNLKAKSRAKAVGPWQFMKATGTRYGLKANAWIDERRDPLKATEAAARYLKDLYLMFESWYLAASAYNAGEYRILRAMEALKTNNYWKMCETHELRRETKDYVPKLIAAAIIAKNPTRYGFDDIAYQDPLEYESVQVDFPLRLKDLANLVDTSLDEIEELNPALRRSMVPPGLTYEIRIPQGTKVLAERGLVALRSTTKGLASTASIDDTTEYTVRRGDNLRAIARKYNVNLSELSNANNISPKEKLSPGSTILIPKRAIAKVKGGAKPKPRGPASISSTDGNFINHEIARGESVWSIAEKYNVTVQDIFKWNGLKRSQIQAGRRIRVKVVLEDRS